MTGVIFDIKGFSVHDGDGARTTVFLKGCPLNCGWCHNPEGISRRPQLFKKRATCANCGACHAPCAHAECRAWGICLYACPQNLTTICGYEITETELAAKLLKNKDFLATSGGGITFSGGEPLMQTDFILSLLPLLEGLNTAVETSGHIPAPDFQKAANAIDHTMFDLKLADPIAHEKHTGVKNDLILKNLIWLQSSGLRHTLRIPLIPGITDTRENLTALSTLAGESKVELLPYNNLAASKYAPLGKPYPLSITKNERPMRDLPMFFQNATIL
jgi:glycyl-radical enzyme activating protein family